MKINVVELGELSKFDAVILPMYEEQLVDGGFALPMEAMKASEKFSGKAASNYVTSVVVEEKIQEIVLVGLGKSKELSYRKLLNVLADGYRKAKSLKAKSVAVVLDQTVESEEVVKAATEAIAMADYKFDDFKSEAKKEEVEVVVMVADMAKYTSLVEEANLLAASNIVARDLVNQPANVMHPESLAKRVEDLGNEYGFEVEILDQKQIVELGMHAFMAVAQASAIEPKFIIMRHNGDKSSEERLGLVGKGLTYDAGGLSIKPTAGMVTMKDDMGGSAAVIGAMCAIAGNNVKKNVTAVVAACENMIAGNSYKPGDIIDSMGGKSIYIGNTDAEGRLTLIDAMHYIVTKESVSKVLDIATLTGAAIHCTGSAASVAISNDDDFYNVVQKGFDLSGEQVWRMPIFDEYKELIKHEEADLTNTAGSPGTITAGLFIGEFNGDLPWVHVDIAGTIWSKKTSGILSSGGTGIAVRPLYYLAKEI